METILRNGDDVGKLLLRGSVGGFILVHGVMKVLDPNQVEFIAQLFVGIGLPAILAYLVYVGEVLAPLLLLLGVRARAAAAVLVATMLVVIFLGHGGEIFPLRDFLWWGIELQSLYLFGALSIVFLGAGKYAFSSNHWAD